MLRSAGLIGPVAALRYQTLKPHAAGSLKEIRTDLAVFERPAESVDSISTQAATKHQPAAKRARGLS